MKAETSQKNTVSGHGVCLKCLMCCDTLLSCGMKIREYCCCLCMVVFLLCVTVVALAIKRCADSGTYSCLSSFLNIMPANESLVERN